MVDPRVQGLTTVGWMCLAALGICIPLTAITLAFTGAWAMLLPIAVLVGSGLMAFRVCTSKEQEAGAAERRALEQRVSDLEQRLGNLEMIDSMEAHFAARHRQEREGRVAEVMGPGGAQAVGGRGAESAAG